MRKTNCFPTLRPAALSLLTVLLTVLDLSHANAMSAIKSIKTLLPATRPHWVGDGFNVFPVFSHLAFSKEISPFLMFDYAAPKKFAPNKSQDRKGVGQHPHRGFETVTLAYQGEVEHADSIGNKGVIGAGDVQWMTAGRGIIHQEYHSTEWSKKGGVFEFCQLWVNLPAKHKMTAPRYQGITKDVIPTVNIMAAPPADSASQATCTEETRQGFVRIIAGSYGGVDGPAKTWTPVNMLEVQLDTPDIQYELTLPESHNLLVFVRRGGIGLQDGAGKETDVGPQSVALMNMGGTRLLVTPREASTKLILLSGEPIDEPIASRGPFVMNTNEELNQAMRDYQAGSLGR